MTKHNEPAPHIDPKKLTIAAVFDGLLTLAGGFAYAYTGEIYWLIGALLLGSIPLVWVILSGARGAQAGGSNSIVNDPRGRR